MKRYFALILALALFATMFVGCRGKDNVSENENGMIEDSENSAPSTVPTTQDTTPATKGTEDTGSIGDIIPGNSSGSASENGSDFGSDSSANGSDSNSESNSGAEESSPAGRSRRNAPRF